MKKNLIVSAIIAIILMVNALAENTDSVNADLERLRQLQQSFAQSSQASNNANNSVVTPNNLNPSSANNNQGLNSGLNKNDATLVSATNSSNELVNNQTTNSQQVTNTGSNNSNINEELSFRDQAFVNMSETLLPMSPNQIKRLRQLFDEVQYSSAQSASIPPRPTSVSAMVNLAPGATPPIVRLGLGFVTSLVFVDATGAAWPIQSYDVGDPKTFNIQWDKQSNTLMVQSLSSYKNGNLAVLLKGLNTPVMITLLAGQKDIDYRVDMQIPRLGPQAYPTVSGLPNSASPSLLNVLNGIAPEHSSPLKVLGGDAQAWRNNDKLYLRTNLTVISPSWTSMMSGPDGVMHAYELPIASVILALHEGRMLKLSIGGL